MSRQLKVLWDQRTYGEYPDNCTEHDKELFMPPWNIPYEVYENGVLVEKGVYLGCYVNSYDMSVITSTGTMKVEKL